ncbi:MAG: hypothetical protein MJ212_00170 [Alphaproteobacteria bacterium]|nr:hypothetical protein [Alphaproteobacteria bacterium]
MIAKLRGIIDTIGEDYTVIDVNGVGYLVSASTKTLAKLSIGSSYSTDRNDCARGQYVFVRLCGRLGKRMVQHFNKSTRGWS